MGIKIKKIIKKIRLKRTTVLVIVFIFLSSVLVRQLFSLQIIQGEDYISKFQTRTTKTRVIKSTRGNIYDRNGTVVASNVLAYSVTFEDSGTYNSTREKNLTLNGIAYQVLQILSKNGDSLSDNFHITVNDHGDYAFDVDEGFTLNRFRADIYGEAQIDDLSDEQKNATAAQIMDHLTGSSGFSIVLYGKDAYTPEELAAHSLPEELTKQEILEIAIMRYQLNTNSFKKYMPVTIATNVSEKSVAAIKENQAALQGIDIVEDSTRKYVDDESMAPILGYTGQASSEELETLRKDNPDYSNDAVVGKAGIEQYMELELQGKDGEETVTVDNLGKVLDIDNSKTVDPVAGNDVYLTIDSDWQKSIYQILEQRVAGIVLSKLTPNKSFDYEAEKDASKITIPIYDVYNALIENSTIDISHFSAADATEREQRIYALFQQKLQQVLAEITQELTVETATVYNDLSDEMQEYETFIVDKLLSSTMGILSSTAIDEKDATYQAWNDGTISLRDYLTYAASQNWIDISALTQDDAYLDSQEVYQKLTEVILDRLANNTTFAKKMYHYMLLQDMLDGYDICNLMYDQNLLTKEDDDYAAYVAGNMTPFQLLSDKIAKLEITPAQLALDPCSGSAVITDPNTGAILACVSYPGYDNNRLANQMDTAYWAKLNTDESSPLYNKATQQKTAPGSTFKPLIAVAGLSEGIITPTSTINCNGLFGEGLVNESDYVHCHQLSGHGDLNIVGAIQNSCNVFFCTLGYRLGLDENGTFTQKRSLEMIQKYADMFKLDEKTGIEISETDPNVTDSLPIPSSIGQGTNNYTTTQLARYVTTIANSGTVYNLSLLQKATDSDGNDIDMGADFGPTVNSEMDVDSSIWDLVHEGMRKVISVSNATIFPESWPVELSGKTGTAEEDHTRANHGLFMGFSHYESRDDIALAVRIPFGYSSMNAELVAKDILDYYYGLSDDILSGQANSNGVASVRAD